MIPQCSEIWGMFGGMEISCDMVIVGEHLVTNGGGAEMTTYSQHFWFPSLEGERDFQKHKRQ